MLFVSEDMLQRPGWVSEFISYFLYEKHCALKIRLLLYGPLNVSGQKRVSGSFEAGIKGSCEPSHVGARTGT